jgi:23S rRNA pseudouridine1911/1915/1917 synthase
LRITFAMPTRSFMVGRHDAGKPLLHVLCQQLRLSRTEAATYVRQRLVRLAGRVCPQPGRQVRPGQRVEVALPKAPRPQVQRQDRPGKDRERPAGETHIVVRYVDDQLVVVDKPPGLTTVRHAEDAAEFGSKAKRFLPPTVIDLLPAVLAGRGVRGGRLRAVHRLDRETSGLLVVARTPDAERALGLQFRRHGIGRHYLALVRGQAQNGRIESNLVRDRGDGRRGSKSSPEGQHAATNVLALEVLGNYTLVECRLETGRTHQVRIHLGEAGTPLCGERVYDRPVHGPPLPDGSGAKRPMLHAASLEFEHPTTGQRLRFTAPLPRDMKSLLERLRRQASRR